MTVLYRIPISKNILNEYMLIVSSFDFIEDDKAYFVEKDVLYLLYQDSFYKKYGPLITSVTSTLSPKIQNYKDYATPLKSMLLMSRITKKVALIAHFDEEIILEPKGSLNINIGNIIRFEVDEPTISSADIKNLMSLLMEG